MPFRRLIFHLVLAGLLIPALSACSRATPTATVAPTVEATMPPVVTATQAPVVTPSSTPAPAEVILLASAETSPDLLQVVQSLLAEQAAQSGLSFETRAGATPGELEGAMVVVVLPPDPGLAELASGVPQVQFLGVNLPGEAGENLTRVDASQVGPDQAAFLAGYIAAVSTPNWRIGLVRAAGTPEGTMVSSAFRSGASFFCGLCRSLYPPFPASGYPIEVEITAGSGETEWQQAVAGFETWEVQIVYVDPAISSEAFLRFLAERGYNLIGAGPPPAGIEDHWMVSLGGGDLAQAVQAVWPDLLEGRGSQAQNQSLSLQNVNEELLTPGKQVLVGKILSDLADGFIDTGIESGSDQEP